MRPAVEAVVHTHSRCAAALARPGWPVPPVHCVLTTLGPGVEKGVLPVRPATGEGRRSRVGRSGR
uniref:hypothetical protein n=1 Tax=Rubrobacter marinus TaxID=2653852 RepID=UPI00389A2BD5